MHAFKFIGLNVALAIAWVVVLPGALWQAHIFKETGYRAIDLL